MPAPAVASAELAGTDAIGCCVVVPSAIIALRLANRNASTTVRVFLPPPAPTSAALKILNAPTLQMICAHCSTQADADTLWRMLTHVPDDSFQPVTVDVDGHGTLYRIIRQDGHQTTAPPAAPLAHIHPA